MPCDRILRLVPDALVWYIANTENTELRHVLLPAVANGEILGGTGLSNP